MSSNRFLFTALLVFGIQIFLGLPKFQIPTYFSCYLVFAFLSFFSLLYCYDQELALVEVKNILMCIAIFLAICNYCVSKNRILLFICAFTILLAIYSYFIITSVGFDTALLWALPKSYNLIALEAFLGVALSIVAAKLTQRTAFFIATIYFSAMVLATGSVKTIIALIFLLSPMLLSGIIAAFKDFIFRPRFLKILMGSAGLAGCAIVFLMMFSSDFFVKPIERFVLTTLFLATDDEDYQKGSAGSVQGMRQDLIFSGIEFWQDHFFFGAGINNYRYLYAKKTLNPTYSHSTPIEVLVGVGFFGTLAYYLFLSIIAIRITRSFFSNQSLAAKEIGLAFFGFCLISLGQRTYADFNMFVFFALENSINRCSDKPFLNHETVHNLKISS